MSTASKSRLTTVDHSSIDTLAIIAGGGQLPARLAETCREQGISPFIVGLKGQVDPALLDDSPHYLSRLGASGAIIKTLKEKNITDLVLVGHIRRPSLKELRPDARTLKFFARLGFKALGDDQILKALRKELEKEGFAVHGVHSFLKDIVPESGPVGKLTIPDDYGPDIARGIQVLAGMAPFDVGQAIVVQEGLVLGLEAIEGTDELIRRCSAYRRTGRKPVLVKLAKAQQDRDLDLPTIGPRTVELCVEHDYAGIVGHAGHSLLLSPQEIAREADRNGLFVVAVDPRSYTQ